MCQDDAKMNGTARLFRMRNVKKLILCVCLLGVVLWVNNRLMSSFYFEATIDNDFPIDNRLEINWTKNETSVLLDLRLKDQNHSVGCTAQQAAARMQATRVNLLEDEIFLAQARPSLVASCRGVWQANGLHDSIAKPLLTDAGQALSVYSAYVDRRRRGADARRWRQEKAPTPVARVHLVGSNTVSRLFRFNLACQFLTSRRRQVASLTHNAQGELAVMDTLDGYSFPKSGFLSYLVSCDLPDLTRSGEQHESDEELCAIKLISSEKIDTLNVATDELSADWLPLREVYSPQEPVDEAQLPRHQFALCTPFLPTEFKYPVSSLVEWLEVNLEMGFTLITIYLSQPPSKKLWDVLVDFMVYPPTNSEGNQLQLNLVPAYLSPNKSQKNDAQNEWRPPVNLLANDCLYRNMMIARFLVVSDFHELFTPLTNINKNGSLMMRFIDSLHGPRHNIRLNLPGICLPVVMVPVQQSLAPELEFEWRREHIFLLTKALFYLTSQTTDHYQRCLVRPMALVMLNAERIKRLFNQMVLGELIEVDSHQEAELWGLFRLYMRCDEQRDLYDVTSPMQIKEMCPGIVRRQARSIPELLGHANDSEIRRRVEVHLMRIKDRMTDHTTVDK